MKLNLQNWNRQFVQKTLQSVLYNGTDQNLWRGDKAVEETAEVAEKTTEDAEETTEEAEETTEEAEETAEATTHKDKTKPGKATLCCFFLLNLPSHSQQP